MTLPDERYRAIESTREFLLRLCSPYVENGIKRVPSDVRKEARRLLKHFPDSWVLTNLVKTSKNLLEVPDRKK